MSMASHNQPISLPIWLGSLNSDDDVPAVKFDRPIKLINIRLINGADTPADDLRELAVNLKNGSDNVATFNTLAANQGPLTALVGKNFAIVDDSAILPKSTDLHFAYDETVNAGAAEVTRVICVADVADSLDQKTFIISDDSGTVGVWIDTNGSGTAPAAALGCARQLKVTASTGNTAAQIATAVASAVDADSKFAAVVALSTNVVITDVSVGVRADGTASTSGFTVSVDTQGAAASSDVTLTNAMAVLTYEQL